jgi:hypothetical protein
MAAPRRFELEDLLNRPGTYFNPTTEVMVIVDDGQSLDPDLFEDADHEGGDWVLLGEDVPVDESAREELVERFEVRHHPGPSGAVAASEDDPEELDEGLEPDEDDDL